MKKYDHIQQKLKNYSVEMNKDRLWANTAHAIPQKRKKRGAFFLLLGGALLISSAVTFFALSVSKDHIDTKTEIKATSNPPAGTPANETNDITNRATTERTTPVTSALKSTQETAPNSNTITEKSNPLESSAKTSKPASRSNATKLISSDQITSAENVSARATNLAEQTLSTNTLKAASLNNPELVVPETFSNEVAAANTVEATYPTTMPSWRNEAYLSNFIPTLPVSKLNILSREISTAEVVASRTKNKNRINLLFMQSFGWSTMKIVTDHPELQPAVDAWKNNMSSLENLSTSLQASVRLPKGIQLGAGLQYSKLTTQLEYQQTSSEDYLEPGITEIIIDEQGNVENLMGDVHVHRQTIIRSTRFTSQSRLDVEGIVSIPVIRNYRTETGVWVKAGYNILYRAEGTTFGPGDVPVNFGSDDNPFTLQSPFTFGTGIATLYRLNPHWNLSARVGYERLRYTHGLYDDQISFHHSVFSLGLGAGYTF